MSHGKLHDAGAQADRQRWAEGFTLAKGNWEVCFPTLPRTAFTQRARLVGPEFALPRKRRRS